VDSLPTLPQMYQQICEMADDPATTVADFGALISEDPALTGKLLKLVNSALYSFPRRVSSITRAVVILGFNAVKQLSLSISIVKMFKPVESSGFDLISFWEHSVATAVLGKAIGQRIGMEAVEEIFVGGLLHDIGKLVAHEHFLEAYTEALDSIPERHRYLLEAEVEALGVDHTWIGRMIAERWKLPDNLVDMIRYHHRPEVAKHSVKAAAILQLADALAIGIGWGSGGNRWVPPISAQGFEMIGIPISDLNGCLRDAEAEYSQVRGILAANDA